MKKTLLLLSLASLPASAMNLPQITEAAERDNVIAQLALAKLHDADGERNPEAARKSVYWLERAAGNGSDFARMELAERYLAGRGVARDHGKALQLFRQAAERDGDARVRLGDIHREGVIVPQDEVAACDQYAVASRMSNAFGHYRLAICHSAGKGRARDRQEANRLYALASKTGLVPEADYRLAQAHARGLGMPVDHRKAVEHYRQAAERGVPEANHDLGNIHFEGRWHVPKDEAQAVRHWRSAAEAGYAGSQANLGIAYVQGRGVGRDRAEGLRWLRKAAGQGNALAREELDKLK